MGFAKWLARKGAVGGTARWAATLYTAIRREHPDAQEVPDDRVFVLMVRKRYEVLSNSRAEDLVAGAVGQVRGLHGLVVAILVAEAGFAENDRGIQEMFMEVIGEELAKSGLPSATNWGAS